MQLTINTKPELDTTLQKYADADAVSVELWCERKLDAIIARQLKEDLANRVINQKAEDLVTIDTAVSTIEQTIATRDYVEPTPRVNDEL